VVRQSIDQGGDTSRVREDRPPLLEREVRRDEERAPLVAAADDLEEEIGRPVVVGQIPKFIAARDKRGFVTAP